MSRKAKHILIVEDDPATAELIAETLAHSGFKSLVAREGGEALRLIEKHLPSAITLDLSLPGLDGRSFLLGLRSNESTKRTPVIVVSSNSENLSAFERRSVAHVIPKPFDLDELRDAVLGAAAYA